MYTEEQWRQVWELCAVDVNSVGDVDGLRFRRERDWGTWCMQPRASAGLMLLLRAPQTPYLVVYVKSPSGQWMLRTGDGYGGGSLDPTSTEDGRKA